MPQTLGQTLISIILLMNNAWHWKSHVSVWKAHKWQRCTGKMKVCLKNKKSTDKGSLWCAISCNWANELYNLVLIKQSFQHFKNEVCVLKGNSVNQDYITYQGFQTRMIYLDKITWLRCSILVRNPQYETFHIFRTLILYISLQIKTHVHTYTTTCLLYYVHHAEANHKN